MAQVERSDRTFIVAGISVDPSGYKTFRFSNTPINQRVSMLATNGHTDIDLRDLPRPMTQIQAAAWVLNNVRGSRGAVIATRATDKEFKSELVLEIEALAAKQKVRSTGAKAKTPVKRTRRTKAEMAIAA